ncbi:hypothetical protein [Porphyrobacter sp. YT40]|uniref:hypothetical protein n=1 Tax=Porphyrobacter sp. YT40 TaxID=2547601 RepID=UPI00114133E5|nr:hypothetical protein [Porphyrobacter sp. YT40]QDH33534.1 hypothetical protein E2E27_03775 [Porphyrobacter sp. YT40]
MQNAFQAFARAVGWGTLAGAAPYSVLFMIPLAAAGLGEGEFVATAMLFAYPLVLSGAMVLGSALLFGLPLTFLMSRTGQEHGGAYALAGLLLGAVVPPAIIWLLAGEVGVAEGLFFAAPGAFAGLVTGTSWGRWREARQAAQDGG